MNKNYIVTKSNDLINAKYSLSIEEQRIILVLASMVQPEDSEFKLYKFSIKDFLKLINVKDKKKYSEIPKITRKLVDKSLEIRYGNKILQTSWLSSVEYETGLGYVELEFSPKLKPFLLGLKEFYTTYKLDNVLNLKSKYSIRLYEVLKSCQYKKVEIISVEDLKVLLGIDKKYLRFYDIKTKIIDKVKNELAKKTDIQFTYEEIKEGRITTKLKFYIISNKELTKPVTSKLLESNNEFENQYSEEDICLIKNRIEMLTKGNVTYKAIYTMLDNKGKKKVEYYLDNYKKFKASKHNPTGFLIKAIMEEYDIPQEEINTFNQKPVQSTNFDQRVYDDDFFESLYDNFREQDNSDDKSND
jgi:plasmid replication initiation protein